MDGAGQGFNWAGQGAGGAQMQDFGEASLLQLLQQQAALAQLQQQPQQQQKQRQQQQQQQAAAQQQPQYSTFGMLQQPAVTSGFPGFQPQAYGVPQQGLYAPQAGYGGMPVGGFLPADFLQQQMAAAAPSAPARGNGNGNGSGTLPPAILQHQQAALARQAAAGPLPTLPLVPPASVASNGGVKPEPAGGMGAGAQPNWSLLQQHAAAAAAAATVPLPLPGFTLPVAFAGADQPASSTAHGAAEQQGAAAAAAAVLAHAQQDYGGGAAALPTGPRRRGRQPKDPSTLTEKQLRAREAQKRFRDKQKRQMAETEAAVGETVEELERLRVSNESQKLKNEVLERLLQYKEAQVHALEFQKQMDPPPRFVVSAEMVDMMRREGIAGLFTPDVLLRYAVAGFTEHMDERGEVKEPPPFEKVAMDWGDIVNDVRHILDAARQGFRPPEPKVPPPPAAAADDANPLAAGLPPGARVSRPQELVELHSGSAGGSMGSAGGGAAAAARPAGASTSGSKHARPGVNGAEVDQPQHRDQRRSLDAAASLGNSGGSGGGGVTAERVRSIEQAASNTGDGHGLPDPEALKAALRASVLDAAAATTTTTTSGGSAGDRQRRAAPVKHLPENVKPEVAAIAEEAPDDVLEAAEAKDDPIARFVLARILSQTAAHSHLQWDTLVDGATVHDGADTYCFTGKQLRSLASLMRRVGLVLWQQALLFPQHITKLGMLRLDDPNNLHVEEQSMDHWRSILRRLNCREEQLRKIVAGHQRYIAHMNPVLEERKEALEEVKRMTTEQMQNSFTNEGTSSTQRFVEATSRLTEATGLVMQTVSAQHAAYCELLIAVFYALTFPVQRPQLFVLSWPYFPQLQLLGRAAALELGMDISDYPTYSSDRGDS